MTPAGYRVKAVGGQPMLILTQASAVDKAAVTRGIISPLYSGEQVIDAIEELGNDPDFAEYDIENAIAVVRALNLDVLQ